MDPAHVMHAAAHAWFAPVKSRGWATCPIVQNGVIRVASQPAYPNSPGSSAAVMELLGQFIADRHHEFWPDALSLLDPAVINRSGLSKAAHVTDVYLLALAVRHGGRLATFEAHIPAIAVINGMKALTVIPAK